MSRHLPSLLTLILLLPTATGLVIEMPAGATLDSMDVPAGEPLVVIADGDLYLAGTLATHAVGPGDHGPNIVVAVTGELVLLPGARLVAASGNDGGNISGVGRVAALDGGDGGSIFVHARHVVSQHAFLQAGSGGRGGDALARGEPHAVAFAGNGGRGGVVLLNATMAGYLVRVDGDGGDGGDAEAVGGDACTSRPGRDDSTHTQNETVGDAEHADARGEAGGCPIPGEDGGPGGNATAIGGNGGYAENGPGGNGGDATAIGGRGADALDLCFETTHAAETSGYTSAGDGGAGGTPIAVGGNGGTGLNGGRGGDAYAESRGGNGGNATMPIWLGAGGANRPGGGVHGGSGGFGAVDGGPGGGAIGKSFSGDSGSGCGPLPARGLLIPATPPPWLGLALLGAAATTRRRRV